MFNERQIQPELYLQMLIQFSHSIVKAFDPLILTVSLHILGKEKNPSCFATKQMSLDITYLYKYLGDVHH